MSLVPPSRLGLWDAEPAGRILIRRHAMRTLASFLVITADGYYEGPKQELIGPSSMRNSTSS